MPKPKQVNVLFAGVGGQGIVLASKLVAQMLLKQGAEVRTAETIGMAQRGGTVLSHLRAGWGEGRPFAPLIAEGEADLLIALEPGEAVRALSYLKPGGAILSLVHPVSRPKTSASNEEHLNYLLKQEGPVVLCDATDLCARLGTTKLENTALLGAGAKAELYPLEVPGLLEVMDKFIKPRWREVNEIAITEGAAIVRQS